MLIKIPRAQSNSMNTEGEICTLFINPKRIQTIELFKNHIIIQMNTPEQTYEWAGKEDVTLVKKALEHGGILLD